MGKGYKNKYSKRPVKTKKKKYSSIKRVIKEELKKIKSSDQLSFNDNTKADYIGHCRRFFKFLRLKLRKNPKQAKLHDIKNYLYNHRLKNSRSLQTI